MIVGFVLILSIVGIALATALYSNFLPYFVLLSDIKHYNMAYYGANTAIERSLLVLRYQEAGFEATGSLVGGDPVSDLRITNDPFAYYTDDTTLEWNINSRPSELTIPGKSLGNVDKYLLSGASNDRNTLTYRDPQSLYLRVDDTKPQYAYVEDDNSRKMFQGENISLQIILNPFLKNIFGGNNSDLDSTIDIDGDTLGDDVIVDRGWKGMNTSLGDFSIISRSLLNISTGDLFVKSDDESIREKDINGMGERSILFGENINPLYRDLRAEQRNNHMMIANAALVDEIQGYTFNKLLGNENIQNQALTFFLTKPLLSIGGNIYPFLQYQIRFKGERETLSQPYFFVHGESQVGEYTVQMNLRKSVDKNKTLGSFTVIF